MNNKELKRRIIEISYKKKLSHIGSCLTAVDIIDEIFQTKKSDEKFILSSGHAGLALYVVLEKYQEPHRRSAEEMFDHHGVHPDRCISCGIDCSSGSLGHGLPIAVGMALAEKQNFDSQIQDSCPTRECQHQRIKNVYCLISDGECSEGSILEALRIADQNILTNLKIYVNINGWAAYQQTTSYWMPFELLHDRKIFPFIFIDKHTNVDDFPFLIGQIGHYKVMNEEEYKEALEVTK